MPHGNQAWRQRELRRLADRIRQLERGGEWEGLGRVQAVKTSWPGIDHALGLNIGGGLWRGCVHEWFGTDSPCRSEAPAKAHHRWSPPLSVLIHLAWCAIEEPAASHGDERGGLVLWIGRSIWPHPRALARWPRFTAKSAEIAAEPETSNFKFQISNQKRVQSNSSSPFWACLGARSGGVELDRRLLAGSIFVDPPDDASRVWAIDVALRSPAVAAVIADGCRIAMAESRRLQLAAEAGGRHGGVLALLARTSGELDQLSAAATRWRVRRTPSPTSAPRWIVELLRCKANPLSAISAEPGAQRWIMESDRATGRLACLADVVDRSNSTPLAQMRPAVTRERSVRQIA